MGKCLPKYYAFLIIAAVVPQAFGFNGSGVDTAWKGIIIIVFLFATFRQESFFLLTKFGCFFIILFLSGQLITLLYNNSVGFSSLLTVLICFLMFYILYELPAGYVMDFEVRDSEIYDFYRIYVYFIIAACIYNIIINFNAILNFTSLTTSSDISSFFDNKNSFGVYLMFATLASVILMIKTGRSLWILSTVLFILTELICMCRTAIILSLILVILAWLFAGNGSVLSRVVILLIIAALAVFLFLRYPAVYNYIFNNIFGSTKSFEVRNSFITAMLPLLYGGHLVFGYGKTYANELASLYTGNQYFHNTYLKILVSGGIFYGAAFVSCILITIKNSIVSFMRNHSSGWLCFISLAVYLIYAYVESIPLFESPVISMTATMFIVTMPIYFSTAAEGDTEDAAAAEGIAQYE